MKNINTLEQFKNKIETSDFWAENWSIITLERILNIKFIILSSEAYFKRDLGNILQCGVNEYGDEFTPEFYIMVEYRGDHYKLIGYNKKRIFTFREIPYDIKKMVVDKCLERNSGAFSVIPDFVEFKKYVTHGIQPIPKFEELSDAKIRGLYDDNIIFQFYKSSSGDRIPGKGSGETIPKEVSRDFSNLNSIPDWRKKLDDSWFQSFELNNHRWNSVEHYYQASKFKEINPDFYLSFSVESGTKLASDPEMAKAAASSSGKYKGELLRPKEVTIDPTFYDGKRKEKEYYDAVFAKFSQNEDLKTILIETKNAKLLHYKKGKEPELAEPLMFVRDKLKPIS